MNGNRCPDGKSCFLGLYSDNRKSQAKDDRGGGNLLAYGSDLCANESIVRELLIPMTAIPSSAELAS